jgi:7-cyano-7-deazaguanine synthase in queuosine biosynthesis
MTIEYCRVCALPNSFPHSSFDEGVCIICRNAEAGRPGTGGFNKEKALQEIAELFDSVRGNSYFDCIVCYSGGKDSTYVLRQVVREHRLRPLAFTIDNGFIAEESKRNIDRVTSNLAVEHHNIKISWDFLRNLVVSSLFEDLTPEKELQRVSSICSSCIFLVNTVAIKYALQYQAPMIIAGFTGGQVPAAIYGNKLATNPEAREKRVERLEKSLGDAARHYFGLDVDQISKAAPGPYHVNPLMAEDYSEDRVLDVIGDLGWEKPTDTGKCSTNCRLNSLGINAHFMRYRFSPYARETAELVRTGSMSRERGMEIMHDVSFDGNVREALERLGISEEKYRARLKIDDDS